MEEFVEFRVSEKFAPLLFSSNEGQRLSSGMIRNITMNILDPRFEEVGKLQQECRKSEGRPFFFGWTIKRLYTSQEINSAELFQVSAANPLEVAAEEFGTRYQDCAECPICQSGATVIEPFIFEKRKLPVRQEMTVTLAQETLISCKLVEVFRRYGVTGYSARNILEASTLTNSKQWFLLECDYKDVEIINPTNFGLELFDGNRKKDRGDCPRSDLIGLNQLSLVTVRRESRGNLDFAATRQFVGIRRGFIRPHRLVLVSPKVRKAIVESGIRGVEFDIAYLG